MSKFMERFERFKDGTATEEEMCIVREEIEKHEAIEEYIAHAFENTLVSAAQGVPDISVGKRIARKVHLKLIGTILCILIGLAAASAAAVYFCNEYYYNPNEGIETVYGGDGQLMYDLWAFSELHSPGLVTMHAEAWRDGPGCYQVKIYQNNVFSGEQAIHSERIVRGRVVSGDARTPNGYWNFPIANAFGYREGSIILVDETGKQYRYPSADSLHAQMKALEELPASSYAAVYVTFAEDLSLSAFSALYEKWNADIDFFYAAVVSADGYMPNTVGFSPNNTGIILENVPEEYPYFQLFYHDEQMRTDAEAVWEQHVRSMLRYLANRPQFLEAMANVNGIDSSYYNELLAYIDQNGIEIYGVLVSGRVREILSFIKEESPFDFYVSDIKLSVLSRG